MEENLITLSKSIVFVRRRIEVPRKTKVSLKLQKSKVPNIETKNMDMEIAC